MKRQPFWKALLLILSYVAVAVTAAFCCALVLLFTTAGEKNKLAELEDVIREKFIDEVDMVAVEDAAAAAMVDALGNRWSYYIPAAEYADHLANQKNAYVGIGITISQREDGKGFDVLKVEDNSGAWEAGIRAGDIVTQVEGQSAVELGADGAKTLILGAEGSAVSVTVLRGEETLTFQVKRKRIEVTVASGQMLEDNIGLVTIVNFNDRCAEETIAVIEQLLEEGAEALIFDVRFNPGGYKEELVDLLDYLLPEGDLFRSLNYTGTERVDTSDEKCLELPMAVLMNGDSYSAAEFFAAALSEYEWATLVGQPTTGKSHFQITEELSDGSAVNLSVGKYFTPKGVSLADVGGLKPDVPVEVDENTYAAIYAGTLDVAADPQIEAAVQALKTAE